MTQPSHKVISPGSNMNISGPVPGTFQHSKDTTMQQSAGTPKTATRRPPMQLPDIPAPGKKDMGVLRPLSHSPRPTPHSGLAHAIGIR